MYLTFPPIDLLGIVGTVGSLGITRCRVRTLFGYLVMARSPSKGANLPQLDSSFHLSKQSIVSDQLQLQGLPQYLTSRYVKAGGNMWGWAATPGAGPTVQGIAYLPSLKHTHASVFFVHVTVPVPRHGHGSDSGSSCHHG